MANIQLDEFHSLLAIVQSIDVGVVVLDRDYQIEVWNTFMENRSGILPAIARRKVFFDVFPEVDPAWFRQKFESVATLGTPSFSTWEQRPYLVRFKNYQPITGLEEFMYQNITMMPLRGLTGITEYICILIYDVTDVAVNRRQLQAANEQLQRLSSTDRLTGLYNRGHWEEMLRVEYARHRRYESRASLVMFDIDHFKRINDTRGHPAGDRVIQSVAECIRENIRDSDLAGRYGGEEFVVLLPDTDKKGALIFAERMRACVEALSVVHDGAEIRFTISLGVADLSLPTTGYAQLIEWADQALYASKAGGRNRVTAHEPG